MRTAMALAASFCLIVMLSACIGGPVRKAQGSLGASCETNDDCQQERPINRFERE